MHRLAFLAPLGAAVAFGAGPAMADPASINVTLGPDLQEKVEELGQRDVSEQTDRLAEVVRRALADSAGMDGARIDLVLMDLKPNRPTFEQIADRPGLDPIRSMSIGGAAIEGSITTADGQVLPVKYDWYSSSLADVRGFGTWQDADRAYQRLGRNLAVGRYVTR